MKNKDIVETKLINGIRNYSDNARPSPKINKPPKNLEDISITFKNLMLKSLISNYEYL